MPIPQTLMQPVAKTRHAGMSGDCIGKHDPAIRSKIASRRFVRTTCAVHPGNVRPTVHSWVAAPHALGAKQLVVEIEEATRYQARRPDEIHEQACRLRDCSTCAPSGVDVIRVARGIRSDYLEKPEIFQRTQVGGYWIGRIAMRSRRAISACPDHNGRYGVRAQESRKPRRAREGRFVVEGAAKNRKVYRRPFEYPGRSRL